MDEIKKFLAKCNNIVLTIYLKNLFQQNLVGLQSTGGMTSKRHYTQYKKLLALFTKTYVLSFCLTSAQAILECRSADQIFVLGVHTGEKKENVVKLSQISIHQLDLYREQVI